MKLEAWRQARDLTQADIARRLGVSAAAVCRYEAGLRIPDRDVMARIAQMTRGEVGPADFYGFGDAA